MSRDPHLRLQDIRGETVLARFKNLSVVASAKSDPITDHFYAPIAGGNALYAT